MKRFDGIKDAEEYGKYMICESGHFEYDHNLEEYIDFKRYREVKMSNELGAFSSKEFFKKDGISEIIIIL